jgi:hypothetical protein
VFPSQAQKRTRTWATTVVTMLALSRHQAAGPGVDLPCGPQRVTLLRTVVLLILRRPPSLTRAYAVRSRTTRPSSK